jgi:hypothetical protein
MDSGGSGCGLPTASLVLDLKQVTPPPPTATCCHQLLVDLMSPAALFKACALAGAGPAHGRASAALAARQTVKISADICRAVTAGLRGGGGAAAASGASAGAAAVVPASSSEGSCDDGKCSEAAGASGNSAVAATACTTASGEPARLPTVGLPSGVGALLPCGPAACASCLSDAVGRPALMPPELLGSRVGGCWSVVDDPRACPGLRDEELEAVVIKVGRQRLYGLEPRPPPRCLPHALSSSHHIFFTTAPFTPTTAQRTPPLTNPPIRSPRHQRAPPS